MKYLVERKILTMHGTTEVRDEAGSLAYEAVTKPVTITDKTKITDPNGETVATFHKKVISIHQVHVIEMADGTVMTMKLELNHPIKNVIDVEENGWKLKGDIGSHGYQIVDEKDQVLAEISRPWVAVHDKCELDVKDEAHTAELTALTIVLMHMLIDARIGAETAAAAGTGAATANTGSSVEKE